MDRFTDVTNITEIVSYEELAPEKKEQVDAIMAEFSSMKYNDIVSYGWDIQAAKNQMVNKIFSNSQGFSSKEIKDNLQEVMVARKSVMPRESNFFRKAYMPSIDEKREFVGVVDALEEAIKSKIQNIFELNQTYYELMWESKKIVERYTLIIIAIDKYLEDNPNSDLTAILTQKRSSFLKSRLGHVNTMVEYPVLCYTNGLTVIKLHDIINFDLHQLQEQLLIQTGINEIKNVLNACDGIRNAIYSLTENNVEELEATTRKLLASEPVSDDEHQIGEKIRKFDEALNRLGSLDMLESAQNVQNQQSEAKVVTQEIVQIEEEKNRKIGAIKNDFSALRISKDSQLQYFVVVDKDVRKMIEEWAIAKAAVLRYSEGSKEDFLKLLKSALGIEYDFAISKRLLSTKDNKIYFAESEPGVLIPAKNCEKLAREFAPGLKSRIPYRDELILLYGYWSAIGELDYPDSDCTFIEDLILEMAKKVRETNKMIATFIESPKACYSSGGISTSRGGTTSSIRKNMISNELIGELYVPIVFRSNIEENKKKRRLKAIF